MAAKGKIGTAARGNKTKPKNSTTYRSKVNSKRKK